MIYAYDERTLSEAFLVAARARRRVVGGADLCSRMEGWWVGVILGAIRELYYHTTV